MTLKFEEPSSFGVFSGPSIKKGWVGLDERGEFQAFFLDELDVDYLLNEGYFHSIVPVDVNVGGSSPKSERTVTFVPTGPLKEQP